MNDKLVKNLKLNKETSTGSAYDIQNTNPEQQDKEFPIENFSKKKAELKATFKPGPFQVVEDEGSGNVDSPIAAPRRRYECTNYETCLDVAAALNWDNFTCRGCSGEIDETLFWRARNAMKKDNVMQKLCSGSRAKALAAAPIEAIEVDVTNQNEPLASNVISIAKVISAKKLRE